MEIKVTSRKYSWATALHGTTPKLVYSQWCVNSLESKGAELVTSKFDLLVTSKWKSFCTQFSTSAHEQSFSVVLMNPLFSQEKKLTLIHFNAFLHLKRNSSFNTVLLTWSISHPMTSGNEKFRMGKQLSLKSHATTPTSVMLHKGVRSHWKKNASAVNYPVSTHERNCDNTLFFSKVGILTF